MAFNQITAQDLHEDGRYLSPTTTIELKIRPLSILYLDDDSDMLDVMKRILERETNFRVTPALDPLEALGRLCQGTYDCILSDYMMPQMDGVSFFKKIRSIGILTPFILTSSSPQEEVEPLARNAGIHLFFTKQAILNEPCLPIRSIIQELSSHRKDDS